VQGVLPNVYKIQGSRLILKENRPESLIGNVEEEEEEFGYSPYLHV
jgi:hypothetical protein